MVSRWEFTKDFLAEVALFQLNPEVRAQFGQKASLVRDGGRPSS